MAILQRTTVGIGQIKIQAVATCLFLCMDTCGSVYGSFLMKSYPGLNATTALLDRFLLKRVLISDNGPKRTHSQDPGPVSLSARLRVASLYLFWTRFPIAHAARG
uniref:Uncharacterized protein n=1 Tax=Anopheles culicifacies TaxID=139723 RepID=A0A182MKZ2_9DIPT